MTLTYGTLEHLLFVEQMETSYEMPWFSSNKESDFIMFIPARLCRLNNQSSPDKPILLFLSTELWKEK